MNTKAIAILGAIFILIVGTLGFLVYSKYSAKPDTTLTTQQQGNASTTPNPEPVPTPTPDPATTTPITAGSFVKLTDEQVVSPVLFYDGKGITYFNKQGSLFQAAIFESDGKTQLDRARGLEIKTKTGISKVLWPKMGDDFILQFDTATGTTWSYFNSRLGDYVDYPSQIISVDWMPSGDKIAYVWLEGGKATLNISDPDTKNWQQVSELWETDDEIRISPDGMSVAYYRNGAIEPVNKLNITTPDGKLWKSLVSTGYNFGSVWSPDSTKLLYTQRDPSTAKFQLWVYDILTGDTVNLKVYTSIEKVVWSGDSKMVYAATPLTGSAGLDTLTSDKIVEINLLTSAMREFQSGTGMAVDGRDLFMAKDDSKLFFRNAQDGALYYLDLTK